MIMARRPLTPPSFKKDAVPTSNGWRHPKTGELLVSKSISQEEIDEYMGVSKPEPKPKTHENMSKAELEAKGREHGIELDRRKSHDDLVDELEDHIENDYHGPDLESMTKRELEALGREHGHELDRRKNKQDLIEELSSLGIA